SFRFDTEGALWIAAAGGLSRLTNGRVATLNSGDGLPCDAVHWTIEDNARAVWLKMSCGLMRVPRSDLEGWIATADRRGESAAAVPVAVFDASDGLRDVASDPGYSPLVAKAADGRLWFAQLDGVGVIDPAHLPLNTRPPPVRIERIIADRTAHDVNSPAP